MSMIPIVRDGRSADNKIRHRQTVKDTNYHLCLPFCLLPLETFLLSFKAGPGSGQLGLGISNCLIR
jgi:hypothetical protein